MQRLFASAALCIAGCGQTAQAPSAVELSVRYTLVDCAGAIAAEGQA